MTSAGKFVYIAHHFILLRISPFGLRVDRKGWWFEHSLSWLRVCLSAEGAKNVSGPWLSPLRGWSSLTMTFTGKLVYMTHYFILLRFNPFDRVNKEGWWFEHSVSQLRVCLSTEAAKNLSQPWLFPLRVQGIYIYIYVYIYICSIIYVHMYMHRCISVYQSEKKPTNIKKIFRL